MPAPPVLIANGFWDEEVPGGSYRMGSDFARYLARREHAVHYLCGSYETDPVSPLVRDGVSLWRYTVSDPGGRSEVKLFRHVLSSYLLARRIRRGHPIAILNGHSQLQYLGASMALDRRVSRRYSSASPLPEEIEANGGSAGAKSAFTMRAAIWIERRVLRVSASVRAYSQFGASLLNERYGRLSRSRVCVLPGWVDCDRFALASVSRAEAPQRLSQAWRGGRPIFFSLRRLVARMGLDNLIEAARILKREGRDFRLLVGGEGPERGRLESLIQDADLADRVFLLGRISESDLPLCYRAADCVVLPTRALECFGLTVVEAYAAGTPVIATPVGSIPEVVPERLRSWLARDVSAAAIAERMREFLTGGLRAEEAALRRHAAEYALERRAAALREWLCG